MSLGNQVSNLLFIETNRAYSNLFEINFKLPLSLTGRASQLTALASKATFEDNFGFEIEYQEAIQANALKSPQRIKGISIVFKETSQYQVLDVMKDWVNMIYDYDLHTFKDNISPEGTIEIVTYDGKTTKIFTMKDVVIKSLTYPTYAWSTSDAIDITAAFSIGRLQIK